MKKIVLFACIVFASMTAIAKDKDKATPLSPKVAEALSGKTLAVTRHERPSFVAMTAGKAGFGLFGVAAMYSAGNEIITSNDVPDPAAVVEQALAPAIARHYSMQLKGGPSPIVKSTAAKEIIAAQAGADYVLDVDSGSWNFTYYPKDWGKYWVGYGVQVRLYDGKSGRQLSKMGCYSDTQKHPSSPSRDALLANRAQLLKDVTASLGWKCANRAAVSAFAVPAEFVDPPPQRLVDPLTTRGRY